MFLSMGSILKSNLPNNFKAKTFDQYVLMVLTSGTCAFNNNIFYKLQVSLRAMERRMVNTKLRDRISNEGLRSQSKAADVGEGIGQDT